MQDLRLALRALLATPIVSIVAALSLALGIGANTALYSIANSLLYRPLPVNEPERLVRISDTASANNKYFSLPVWQELQRRAGIFDAAAAWAGPARFTHTEGVESQTLSGAWVSGSYFDMLGVRAQRGRVLSEADDRSGGGPSGPVMVISDAFWQRRFQRDPSAIGGTFTLEGVPVSIVGVTPRGFFGTDIGSAFDVLVPIAAEPLLRGGDSAINANAFGLLILARLKPGQTREAATAALRAIQPQIREVARPPGARRDPYAKDYLSDPFTVVSAEFGTSLLRRRYQPVLMTLLSAAGLVLFVACANVANLLLARATARRHEFGVRVALGASRWRLVRQLLVESVVLATLAGSTSVLAASWASGLLIGQLSTQLAPIFLDLSIDWRLLAFVVGIAAAVVVVAGVMPALRASAVAPLDALKEHGRGAEYRARAGLPDALVVAQIALSVVLVVAAGLFVRTLASLATRDLGFGRDRVLLARIDSRRAITDVSKRIPTYERVRDNVLATPGVEAAAISSMTPVSNLVFDPPIEVSGGRDLPMAERGVYSNTVTADWFRAYGIPLVAGRQLADGDRAGSEPVAVVSQAFAARFLGGASPIDHFITLPDVMVRPKPNVPIRIVGVVADAVYVSLRETPQASMYLPIAQHDEPGFIRNLGVVNLSVAPTAGSPAALAKSIAASIASVNPQLAVTFRPLDEQVNDSLARERVMAMLAGFFGGVSLLLAAIGLYGVTAYAVARRRVEIGIRMALGAAPAGVVRLVLSRVTMLVAAGIAAGVGVSLWASTFVATLIFGLAPRDPLTVSGAVALLAATGCFAGWLPAWRASRVDPAEVLRET